MPQSAGDEVKRRFSFCCRDCRRRRTPDSLRFMDGKAFPAIIVVMLATLQHGETLGRLEALRRALGVDRRTVESSRRWWREQFASSPFWRGKRGLLPLDSVNLPLPDRIVLAVAAGADALAGLFAMARFLAPWRRTRSK